LFEPGQGSLRPPSLQEGFLRGIHQTRVDRGFDLDEATVGVMWIVQGQISEEKVFIFPSETTFIGSEMLIMEHIQISNISLGTDIEEVGVDFPGPNVGDIHFVLEGITEYGPSG
jgi:hypothetical protein